MDSNYPLYFILRLQDVFKKKFNYNLIDELSTKYQTSFTATLLKFISIGNHPVMMVCTIDSKIKWYKYSDDFPFKYIKALPGFKVPANTSVGQYFYENGTKNENSEEIVFAQDWFSVNFKSDYGRQFKEYCIYSNANKFVMSIIWEK
jgi:hypothetical protein